MTIEAKIIRISDILEQIELLNKQIRFHKEHQGDLSSITQYEYLKCTFIKELGQLMEDFDLRIEPIAA